MILLTIKLCGISVAMTGTSVGWPGAFVFSCGLSGRVAHLTWWLRARAEPDLEIA